MQVYKEVTQGGIPNWNHPFHIKMCTRSSKGMGTIHCEQVLIELPQGTR